MSPNKHRDQNWIQSHYPSSCRHQLVLSMEQQEALLIPDHAVGDVPVYETPAMDDNRPNPRPKRPLNGLAVVAAALVPITLLPYYLARRNISQLRRRLNEYAVIIARLQRDSKTTTLENSLRDDRVRGLLTEIRQESHNMNAEMRQGLERLRAQTKHQKVAQAVLDSSLRSDLQRALEETRHIR